MAALSEVPPDTEKGRPEARPLEKNGGCDGLAGVGDGAHLWNTKAQLQVLQHVVGTLPRPDVPPAQREPSPTPGTARRLKGEQVQELVTAYAAGDTVYQLADRFKIDRRTVSKILKRQDITTRWIRLTETDVDEAERLYAQGLSLARVGERIGVSADTVRLRLLKRGVQMRDPHWRG